jgi:hypothetical protein
MVAVITIRYRAGCGDGFQKVCAAPRGTTMPLPAGTSSSVASTRNASAPLEHVPRFVVAIVDVQRGDEGRRVGAAARIDYFGQDQVGPRGRDGPARQREGVEVLGHGATKVGPIRRGPLRRRV